MYHLCKWASSLFLWWASPVSIQWRYLILVCVLYSLWSVTVTDDNAQDCCPGGNAEKSKTHYAVMTQWHSEQLANTFHVNWAVNTLITATSSSLAITQYANKQSHYKNIKTLILSDSPHSLHRLMELPCETWDLSISKTSVVVILYQIVKPSGVLKSNEKLLRKHFSHGCFVS